MINIIIKTSKIMTLSCLVVTVHTQVNLTSYPHRLTVTVKA